MKEVTPWNNKEILHSEAPDRADELRIAEVVAKSGELIVYLHSALPGATADQKEALQVALQYVNMLIDKTNFTSRDLAKIDEVLKRARVPEKLFYSKPWIN